MLYTNEAINKRKKKTKKVKNKIIALVYILLIPILTYNIILILQSIINPKETPSFLGIKTYVIISGSMQPNINIGDIVVVKKVDINELQVEDIISYRKGKDVITHRINKIETKDKEVVIKTKGDSNNVEDSYEITQESIEGKVVKIIPNIGKLNLLLQNKMIIIIILLTIFLMYSRNIKTQKRKNIRRLKRLEYEEQQDKENYKTNQK